MDTDLVSCSTSSLGVRSREAVLDVQGCTMFCLANGPDSAVHFHRSPAAEEISQFRVCEAVSDEAVARSTVLSSIAEAGGDAQLPGAVTLAGFRIWRNLASGNPDISVKSLCIGYQVRARKLPVCLDCRCITIHTYWKRNGGSCHSRASRQPEHH